MSALLDEKTYHQHIASTFRRVEDALADADPDVVEITATGDMLTLRFASGVKCILNTQRAVRQLWMAARASAWHFSWDASQATWSDDKGRGPLWPILVETVNREAGQDLLS